MQEINLKDKIYMENQIIKVCNELDQKLKDYFKQFENIKIVKVGGELIKKIKDDPELKTIIDPKSFIVEPLKDGYVSLNIYVSYRYSNLTAHIKMCFNGGSYEDKTYYCTYIDRTLYIGNVDDRIFILKEINPQLQMNLIDFDVQNKNINLFKQKSKELKSIKATIHYSLMGFIKYDLVN